MEIWHSEWFGGYVIRERRESQWGPYWDFPEVSYGVLDSMTVKAYKTLEEAEEALKKLEA